MAAGAARATLGSEYQAHSQRQFDVRHGSLLIGVRGRRRVGFLAWDHAGDVDEILAIACTKQRIAAGTALIEAVDADEYAFERTIDGPAAAPTNV